MKVAFRLLSAEQSVGGVGIELRAACPKGQALEENRVPALLSHVLECLKAEAAGLLAFHDLAKAHVLQEGESIEPPRMKEGIAYDLGQRGV
jgi:hypothetical protein